MGAPFRTMRPAGAAAAARRHAARLGERELGGEKGIQLDIGKSGAAGRGAAGGRRMAIVGGAAVRPAPRQTAHREFPGPASGFAGALYMHTPDWVAQGQPHIWLPLCPDEDRHAAAARGAQPRQPAGAGRRAQPDRRVASWWTACHGYNHPTSPRPCAPARRHAARDVRRLTHEPALTLARRRRRCWGRVDRVFYTDSGSVAVEVAMKTLQYWLNQGEAGAAASWRSRAATTATPSAPWRSAIRKRACTACSGHADRARHRRPAARRGRRGRADAFLDRRHAAARHASNRVFDAGPMTRRTR